jgi:type IV pilus assembly protein PilE
MIEVLVVCTVVALLAAVAQPSLRGHDQRAGRMDGVYALTRVQQAQEQYRSAHGLYAGDLSALVGTASRSPQNRYDITLALTGGESYLATATARGPQAGDTACAALTLQVRLGFAQNGPRAQCWLR